MNSYSYERERHGINHYGHTVTIFGHVFVKSTWQPHCCNDVTKSITTVHSKHLHRVVRAGTTCIHIVLLTIYHMIGYCCQILKDIFNYCKGHVEGFCWHVCYTCKTTIQLHWQGLPVSIHCVSLATDTLYMCMCLPSRR